MILNRKLFKLINAYFRLGEVNILQLFNKKKEEKLETTTSFKIKKNEEVISLPEIVDKRKLDIKYPLLEPYAYAHISWDKENNELVYFVEEPKLDESEKKNLEVLENGIKELINISFINIKKIETVIVYLEKNLRALIVEFGLKISEDSFLKIMYYIYRDFIGLNEIEPLLNDYYIEDIECNGSKTPLYIVHRKYRNLRTNIVFENNKVLASLVEKMAQRAGKYVSYASPLLDGRLPDGSRVNATYTEDVTSRGPTFTVRKFTKEPWTPVKLMEFRTVSPEMLAYFWILIENESNIMIIGGTGSGKTSFLNALAFFIPPAARIVSIEDTKELNILHENWLPSVARAGVGLTNLVGQKHGEVSLFDLLKESFRQRPDYVIVGEIRGKEAFVLFQGASSGHPSFSTMHAEDVETMVRRLETEPINLSPSLIASLDVVGIMIQAKIGDKSVRRLKEIDEIINVEQQLGKVNINVPFIRDPRTDKFYSKNDSKIFAKIMAEKGMTYEELMSEFSLRSKLLMQMYKKKVFGFKEVQEVINGYYKNPKEVLRKFNLI